MLYKWNDEANVVIKNSTFHSSLQWSVKEWTSIIALRASTLATRHCIKWEIWNMASIEVLHAMANSESENT